MGLQGFTRVHRGLQGLLGFTWDCKGLQEFTGDYMG